MARSGPVSSDGVCRSCKDVAGRIFDDHRPPSLPQELAVNCSLLFVQPELRSNKVSVRLGNVIFGLDSENRSLPGTLEV